jgi:hypothetical protein
LVIVWKTLYMKFYKRFLTSFEMTINVLRIGMRQVGGFAANLPHPNKDNVMICHSERSEESTIFTGQQ